MESVVVVRRVDASRRRPPVAQVVAVAVGGAIGAPLRYELARWFPTAPGAFPATTLLVNVSGAFLLGALVTLLDEWFRPTRYARALLGIGLLGAYTTFSTFAVEVVILGKDGHTVTALAYAVASLVLGLVAVLFGVACARLGRRRATGGRAR